MALLTELVAGPPVPSTVRRSARALVAAGAAPESRAVAFRVPGRVEVVGKHTDYAGGRSLTLACDRGFGVVGVSRPESGVILLDAVRGESTRWREGRPAGDAPAWAIFPAEWREAYGARFPHRLEAASFFTTQAADGAREILADDAWGPWFPDFTRGRWAERPPVTIGDA